MSNYEFPLKTHEILDRYELLYLDNDLIADFRRSYIDHDLNSIFRIVNDDNKDDLRKLIIENNTWKLWSLLDQFVNTQFTSAFKSFFVNNITFDKDCFSRGQLRSKLWLVDEIKKLDLDLGTVFLCAGWYGTLSVMMFESGIKIDKIRSFDIDPLTVDVAETFNKPWVMQDWKFKATVEDILDIDYEKHCYSVLRSDKTACELNDSPDTIVNTSCEHLIDFDGWYNKIPVGKLVIIQANNYHEVEEHVNTYNTLKDFSKSAPMTTVLYKGVLELPKYTRFMKIGFK
jgi:hypothetical protein